MSAISIRQETASPILDLQRVSNDAQKLCQDAEELIRQSRQLSTESQALKQWCLERRESEGFSQPRAEVTNPNQPFVASARRVPWRRLQLEDMEGVIEWNSPDYTPL